jgi:hypothetical protein
MNAIVEMRPASALAATQNTGRMALAEILQHVALVQEVMRTVMKPDVHYGIIPGTDKPTLYKSGAELLCMVFHIAQSYEIVDMSTDDTVRYRSVCTGSHQLTGVVLGSGMGEASSSEEKYKWRKAYEQEFNATPEGMRRKKSGYSKKDKRSYEIFQVRTEPADLANTVLKMANKRAMLAMVLNVTAASDLFAQDLEDMEERLREHLTRKEGQDAGNDDGAPQPPPAPTFYAQDAFDANLAVWKKVIAKGQKPDDVIAKVNSANAKTPLSADQEAVIRALAPAANQPTASAPAQLTSAQVMEQMRAAKDEDTLNTVMDLANTLPRSDAERAAEESCYDQCLAALRG